MPVIHGPGEPNLGLVYFISLTAMLTGSSFNMNLGVGAQLLLPVFAVPLIHLFVSTSRMRRDAQGDKPGTTPRGFEVITPEEGP